MHDTPPSLPDFTQWPSFPFEGEIRVKQLDDPVPVEPPRRGEGHRECTACSAPDEAYIWVGERWRVRAMDRPTGLPMVLILETRSHLDLGDLPNLLAAELGVMTVRLERAIRSLDGVARVHVNRWGDGSAHLHLWFLARPHGQLQLRGTFLPLWDSILPPIPEPTWRENLALVAAWLAEFGGRPLAEPPRIQWQAPASFSEPTTATPVEEDGASVIGSDEESPTAEGSPTAEESSAAEEIPTDKETPATGADTAGGVASAGSADTVTGERAAGAAGPVGGPSTAVVVRDSAAGVEGDNAAGVEGGDAKPSASNGAVSGLAAAVRPPAPRSAIQGSATVRKDSADESAPGDASDGRGEPASRPGNGHADRTGSAGTTDAENATGSVGTTGSASTVGSGTATSPASTDSGSTTGSAGAEGKRPPEGP